MRFHTILQFILLISISIFDYSFCFFGKKKDPLENYIIDIFFTNSLTIIRCNSHEQQILRQITFDTIGSIKCSNSHLFLPDNQIEHVTLLQWNHTEISCNDKKKKITQERTYLNIIHKAINAFSKISLAVIRVGSKIESKASWKDSKNLLYFEHEPRNTIQNEEIYSFKNRPILCREKHLKPKTICSKEEYHQNLTYNCYYRIGVNEPPTLADMNEEFDSLPNHINIGDDSLIDVYVNQQPKRRKLPFSSIIFGIIIAAVVLLIVIIVIIYLNCCHNENDEHIMEKNSDTSIQS